MKERFCAYCRTFKPDAGFKTLIHTPSGTRRSQCPSCQETRRKPREELNDLANKDREARRAHARQLSREAMEKRNRENPDPQ